MTEMAILVIALILSFFSTEAGLIGALIVAAIIAVRRSNLESRLSLVIQKLDQEIGGLKGEIAGLRNQIGSLRKEKASEPSLAHAAPAAVPKDIQAQPAPSPMPITVSAEPAKPTPVRVPQPIAPPPAPIAARVQESPPPQPPLMVKPAQPVPPALPLTEAPVPPIKIGLDGMLVPPALPKASASTPHPSESSRSDTAPAAPIPAGAAVARKAAPPPTPPPLQEKKPAKPFAERLKSALALEEMLGTNWLNKLGIIILVLGIALFGIYEFNQFGPGGKVALSSAAGLALLISGIYFEKRERYRMLGRAGIGGGWALLFFVSYALHHVQAMKLIESQLIDLVIMLVLVIAIAAHTLRYRSQVVTGLAFLLGYATIALSHDTVYSLSAGAVLALGLVVLILKMGWYELEMFGILSTYANHFFWLWRILGPAPHHGSFPEFYASATILFIYWGLFRTSYVVRRIRTGTEESLSTASLLLNTIVLLLILRFQAQRPELAFYTILALGIIEFSLGQLPIIRRRRRIAFVTQSTMGAILMIASVLFRYSGGSVAVLWIAGAEVFIIAGIVAQEKVFRRIGLITGLAAAVQVAVTELAPFLSDRLLNKIPHVKDGVLFLALGAAFYVNSQFLNRRWAAQFSGLVERFLMPVHSYLGAAAASLCIWALCAGDWTALAWAALMLALAFGSGRLQAVDLFWQSTAIAAITAYRAIEVNLRADADHGRRLITVILLAGAYYLSAKVLGKLKPDLRQAGNWLFSGAGTALITLLLWRELPAPWLAVGWIVFALALIEVARLTKFRALLWHTHILAVLAVVRIYSYNISINPSEGQGISVRLMTMLAVAAASYNLAVRARTELQAHFSKVSSAYTWAAAVIVGVLMWQEVPGPWIAVAWIAYGTALTFIGRRLRLASLCYQENVFAVCAIMRAIAFNYALDEPYGHFTLRLITIFPIAAGLYLSSRHCAPPESEAFRPMAYLHTWAATGLLAALAWSDAPAPWLAVIWVAFALFLTVIDRRFKVADLRWQSHLLAALAAVQVMRVNMPFSGLFHGISVRLITVGIVALVFYLIAAIIRMPDRVSKSGLNHAYSWAASFFAALLMWYELQPLYVAVAWGLFGLLLFEIGLRRPIVQLRFQGYAALASAFLRIFYSNLNVSSIPEEIVHPSIVTVAPLAAIFFFVYSRLERRTHELAEMRAVRVDALLCYAGTISLSALLYSRLLAHGDWIVTAWAALVLLCFAAAWFLKRNIFMHQAILLSFAVLVRGIFYNLFGSDYFAGGDWTGRYAVIGAAVAAMLLSLSFAFRLRNRVLPFAHAGIFKRLAIVMERYPEQVMFFIPISLLTLMLAIKMRAGVVTVAWGCEAVLIILLALAVGERSYRVTGLALILACVVKIVAIDAWRLAARDRYITFIILGAALLAVSYLYSKHREKIRQLL